MSVVKVLNQESGTNWVAYHADTVDVARSLPDKSVDFSIFSPPFANLFCYSPSDRDFGNTAGDDEFFASMQFLIKEQARVMRAGRIVAIHCMQMPTSKERDGFIGQRDFRGGLIRAYQDAGFIYHSEVCIWKDPPTQMQRTKALGLLYKQLRKDSTMSRQAIAEYLIIMRAPGTNEIPVTKTEQSFPVERWQRYASAVWAHCGPTDDEGFATLTNDEIQGDDSSGIDPGDTLSFRMARDHQDERHICPLALGVIRRAIRLWTNPGDVVWTPFGGIGSEGYVAVQEGRKAILAELKASYFKQLCVNMRSVSSTQQPSLFGDSGQ